MTDVLVVLRDELERLITAETRPFAAVDLPTAWLWRPRALVESDESLLQIIPYGVLLDRDGKRAWCYRRTGGDARLEGRCSLGVGGHVERADDAASILESAKRCLQREMCEELVLAACEIPEMLPRFWLHERTGPVGRVHLGIVFSGTWPAAEPPRVAPDEPIEALGFVDLAVVSRDERFELWSRLAASALVGTSPAE